MRVLCSYYNNTKRMALVLDKLSVLPGVALYPVRGTYVKAQNTVKCIGKDTEFLVVPRDGGEIVLATNSSSFAECNKEQIDYALKKRDNIYMQALNLCVEKFGTSGNRFQMDCTVEGCVITATGENGNVSYKIKAPKGECLLEDAAAREQMYSECKGIKAFTYTVVTDISEKEVTVRKGQLEIFREIAHYVNRALLFTKLERGKITREYCITPTGCCELVTKNGAQSIIKVPFTKLAMDTTCSLAAIDISLDVLLKSSYFTQAFRGCE